MANLMDYMGWRGEFGFDKAPWNDVDALIMANLSYLNFHGTDDERGWTLAEAKRLDLVRETLVSAFEDRKAMFEAMADTVRPRSGTIIRPRPIITTGITAITTTGAGRSAWALSR